MCVVTLSMLFDASRYKFLICMVLVNFLFLISFYVVYSLTGYVVESLSWIAAGVDCFIQLGVVVFK